MSFYKHESEWLQFFPFPTPRKEQAEAIDIAIDEIKQGKRFVILDLPTGIGKSSIGITLIRWAQAYHTSNVSSNSSGDINPGGTILTTQRILQAQYMRDFAPIGLRNLESKSNYTCHFNQNENCGDAVDMMRLLGKSDSERKYNSMWRKECAGGNESNCDYVKARMAYLTSPLSITSFAYFLNARKMNPKKQVLVIDEAHNIEQQLMMFVETRIDKSFCENFLNLQWACDDDAIHEETPKAAASRDTFMQWVKDIYVPLVKEKAKEANAKKKKLEEMDLNNLAEAKEIIAACNKIIDASLQIASFYEEYEKNPDNWIAQIELKFVEKNGKQMLANKYLVYKTVDISGYANGLLYSNADIVVAMSATILNGHAFAASVGIPMSETVYISKTSPFPPENRMVYMMGCGNMAMNTKDETLPKMVKAVEGILDDHSGEKGIIHTHTYGNAEYIKQNINKKYLSRLLFHDSKNRDSTLEEHCERVDEDTVLISPSMAEGVDLRDDLSRFQVIMKVPYPFLGDPLIKRKMGLNATWYPYQATKIICQMLGRSIRNESDRADTYILDSGFNDFYKRNKKLFPEWFAESYKSLSAPK
jgi:ATP-dependent DNA helicase DinG